MRLYRIIMANAVANTVDVVAGSAATNAATYYVGDAVATATANEPICVAYAAAAATESVKKIDFIALAGAMQEEAK